MEKPRETVRRSDRWATRPASEVGECAILTGQGDSIAASHQRVYGRLAIRRCGDGRPVFQFIEPALCGPVITTLVAARELQCGHP
jgi:hypothetical protein